MYSIQFKIVIINIILNQLYVTFNFSLLYVPNKCYILNNLKRANLAQLVEQRYRKPQVLGSRPRVGFFRLADIFLTLLYPQLV